jgi:hypothetical protein
METRFEAKVDKELESLNQEMRNITAKYIQVTNDRYHGNNINTPIARTEMLGKHFGLVESKLESIENAVGITLNANAGDDDEDRKRLKEKLKEALEIEAKNSRVLSDEKEPWMEYIFGICERDGRVGKRGSRCSLYLFLVASPIH